MSRKSSRQREDEYRIAERAAEWVILLPDAEADERQEFIQWIKDSPQHLQEFLLASSIARGTERIDIRRLLQDLHIDPATHPNVIQLPSIPVVAPETQFAPNAPTRWRAIAAVILLSITASVLWSYWLGSNNHTTVVGEQKTVYLKDGSIIQLNVQSKIKVSFTETRRDIQLLEGEAVFSVERDPARPFRVHTSSNTIEALGTQFNVRQRPSGTTVSVIEGLIQISPNLPTQTTAPNHPVNFSAGEEARIGSEGNIVERVPVDVITVAAWRHNRLDFRADTLVEIAAEFNRYNESPRLVIESKQIGERRYSGVFDAHNPRSLTDYLKQDSSLAIDDQSHVITVRSANGN